MKLVRVGRRVVNVVKLIVSEEWVSGHEAAPPIPRDGIRVTLETGTWFDLVGRDAEQWRASLAELAGPPEVGPDPRGYQVQGRDLREPPAAALDPAPVEHKKSGGV